MVYEIRKIDVWSVIKISFFIYGIFGFLFGLLYASMLALVGGFLSQMGGEFSVLRELTGGAALGIIGAIFMAIFMGFFYAVIGSVATAIFVWIYNVLATIMGGIRFHLNQEMAKVSMPYRQRAEDESEGMLGNQRYE